MYPFRCQPIYKEKVWGGRWIERNFYRKIPADVNIGESWELCCRNPEVSLVMNGEYAGNTFQEIIRLFPNEMLGERIVQEGYDQFPLLVKILDVQNRLSVQVHPNNEYMIRENMGDLGKNEMWYVLDAEPNAKLIIGVKNGVTPEMFQQSIQDGNVLEFLHEIPIKPGDAFYIPAGTVHAILENIRVVEVQQNSDTTFRIFDWNRFGLDGKPRDLHIKQALDVIDFQPGPSISHQGLIIREEKWQRKYIVACSEFAVEEVEINEMRGRVNPERFEVWVIIQGNGELFVENKIIPLSAGETWFIPASLGRYQIQGTLKLLRCYIPNLLQEIVNPLLQMGYTIDDLTQISGLELSILHDLK